MDTDDTKTSLTHKITNLLLRDAKERPQHKLELCVDIRLTHYITNKQLACER